RNVRIDSDGSKRNRLEIKSVETYQSSVGANPEVPIRGLCDPVDGTTWKSIFCVPLFADVLRKQTVGIEGTSVRDQARQHDSDKGPSSMFQPAIHGRYSNLSITTSFSFFKGTCPW